MKIVLPKEGPKPPVDTRTETLVAEAELTVPQIQDLAEEVGAIVRAAAGFNLKFRLHLELDAALKQPADSVVGEINQHLARIAPDLKLK